MGRDRTGHAGSVLVRFVRRGHGIELRGDRACQIRVDNIDEGINDGDGDICPRCDAVGVVEMQFVDHVLRRVALGRRRRRVGVLL
jgi:hypothetical protein